MEKVPKLQVIEENVLDKYEPPMPDWNCLYWEGVSDEEYEELRTMMKKPVMLEYEAFGRKYPIQLKVTSYLNNGNLASRCMTGSKDIQSLGLCLPSIFGT